MIEKDFNIEIADEVIRIKTLYDCAYEFCKDYLTNKKATIEIVTGFDDMDFERQAGNADGEDIPMDYPDSYLELLAVYRKIVEELINRDVLLIHGSAISFDGNGILFLADSGTGKSTHASIWQKTFGKRVVMINDDKPLVKINDDGVTIYGTPWSGKKGLNTNTKAPLKVMCEIVRSETDKTYTEKMDESAIWKLLMQQTYKNSSSASLTKAIDLLDKLQRLVEFKRIVCTRQDDAAKEAAAGLRDVLP